MYAATGDKRDQTQETRSHVSHVGRNVVEMMQGTKQTFSCKEGFMCLCFFVLRVVLRIAVLPQCRAGPCGMLGEERGGEEERGSERIRSWGYTVLGQTTSSQCHDGRWTCQRATNQRAQVRLAQKQQKTTHWDGRRDATLFFAFRHQWRNATLARPFFFKKQLFWCQPKKGRHDSRATVCE